MITTRKNLDGFAISLMIVLCLLWGLQQVAIKLAAPAISSFTQIGLRSALAAILVSCLIFLRGIRFSLLGKHLLPGLLAGVFFAGEFFCVSAGLNYTSASHMSVFLYTAPIFTVLGLHWLIAAERLQRSQWLGIVSAFCGVAVAFSGALSVDGKVLTDVLLGDALGVLAGLLWAATTLVIRRSSLSEAQPTTTLLFQLAVAGILLLGFAAINGDLNRNLAWQEWDGSVWLNIFFQSVIIAFISYLSWFWLMRSYLTSRLAVFSFLTPLFGVAAGVVFLQETMTPRFAMGAALVLTGIVLVNRRTQNAAPPLLTENSCA